MGKSVLVTGANGFIGRVTAASLEQAGWKVTRGIYSSVSGQQKNEIRVDLNSPRSILELENKAKFDAIVHLGARIGWYGETEAEMFGPNVIATGLLASMASKWNAHLLYASAAIVHGAKSSKIDTKSSISADTNYARSKWLGEQLIEASGSPHCILRIGGVFGLNGPAHLGVNRAIDGALKGILPTQAGNGEALRNYIYVKDVADTVVYTLARRLGGTHLLAGSEALTVNEMLQTICDVFLPGQKPLFSEGSETRDQVIEPSVDLPKSKSFRQALIDINGECQ